MRQSRKFAICSSGSGEIEFTYTGTYEYIQDTARNWRIKFLTSGVFTLLQSVSVDVFCVGGGGSCDRLSGSGRRAGGGGGYTTTQRNQILLSNTGYSVTVGYGGGTQGTSESDGGPSSFGSIATAAGGKRGANFSTGGAGGSGGGGCSNSGGTLSCVGGSDGSNGENGDGTGGAGQGTTTREFGEPSGTLYAGGGSGAGYSSSLGPWPGGAGGGGATGQDGTANTGGGGGGRGGRGGSGIVIIRNAR